MFRVRRPHPKQERLPAGLRHAGDEPLGGHLAELDTADTEQADVALRTAGDLAAVVLADGIRVAGQLRKGDPRLLVIHLAALHGSSDLLALMGVTLGELLTLHLAGLHRFFCHVLVLFCVLERKAELAEQGISLLVGRSRRNEGDLHAEDLGDLVDVDLREDDLLADAQGVVALAVELLVDALEVADTRQGDGDQTLEELVHLRVAQRHAHADGHALTQLEVRDILARTGLDGLLTGDERQLGFGHVDEFLVGDSLAHTLVDDDLLKLRALHDGRVAELLHKGRDDLLLILGLECRYVSHYLISSPDFLA